MAYGAYSDIYIDDCFVKRLWMKSKDNKTAVSVRIEGQHVGYYIPGQTVSVYTSEVETTAFSDMSLPGERLADSLMRAAGRMIGL